MGVYAWFHLSALQKAGRLANEQLSGEQRRSLSRSALFDEAFALHFLEDVFASGHVAGTWGDAAQRKGTHDFYNQNGLETFTWGGSNTSVVLMGDAHMRPEDAKIAADAVRDSPLGRSTATPAIRKRRTRCVRHLQKQSPPGEGHGDGSQGGIPNHIRRNIEPDAGAKTGTRTRLHAAVSQ
jgi:hypothetical protein